MFRHRLAVILPAYFCLYAVSFLTSYLLRFEFAPPASQLDNMWSMLPFVVGIQFLFACMWSEFHRSFRHVAFSDILTVAASTGGAFALIFATNSVSNWINIPRSVICIHAGLSFLLVCSLRALYRVVFEIARPNFQKKGKQRTLIFGIESPSIGILRMLNASRSSDCPYHPVGFVAESAKHHSLIGGTTVHSLTESDWGEILSRSNASHLLIPGETPGRVVRQILHDCNAFGIQVHVIPTIDDLVDGRFKLSSRDLTVSDLLRREPNQLDMEAIQDYVTGKRVMVTGGAGSIGSELCRQIAALKPERLLVVDQSEFGVFTIEREFAAIGIQLDIEYIVADILDERTLNQVFTIHQPQIIFHAAAYKHVPLMEDNPQSAVFNNVLGTKAVADAASKHNVERFVMISTDKAVRPTSVMGASKLMAEKYIQSLAQVSETKFITVRFGNVLNSMGSVVPTFRKQIEAGGPITVTHPEMNRFFMTIPEAVQLVLQAGAIGTSGDVLILDMGEPVKIVDLAKDMIMLSGLRFPDDIDITFTGLRPGEKLYEELFYASESGAKKVHDKIYSGNGDAVLMPQVLSDIRRLEEAAETGRQETLTAFQEIVAQYTDREWVPSRLKTAA